MEIYNALWTSKIFVHNINFAQIIVPKKVIALIVFAIVLQDMVEMIVQLVVKRQFKMELASQAALDQIF